MYLFLPMFTPVTRVYLGLLVFTYVYVCLPSFISLPLFINACLRFLNQLDLCVPNFRLVCLFTPVTRVNLCLLVFTYVYHCLIVHVYICGLASKNRSYR